MAEWPGTHPQTCASQVRFLPVSPSRLLDEPFDVRLANCGGARPLVKAAS